MPDNNSSEKPVFERLIADLDTSLFKGIEAELNEDDRKSLLAVQKSVRETRRAYCYLEIGSHLGGSIQPHMLDHTCAKIFSIDKRPVLVPDNRGAPIEYSSNSTSRMLELLQNISPEGIKKIVCFDSESESIRRELITEQPDICFIDGEHTDRAVVSDFEFCSSVIHRDGVICFHDSQLVLGGLSTIIRGLRRKKTRFNFLKLTGGVSVIALNDSQLISSSAIQELTWSGWRYFASYYRLSNAQKKYFNHSAINTIRPSVKATLNKIRQARQST
jgi:methyltransferase family protein